MAPVQNLRMDRSRDHATVHGERPADDPHVNVHFMQDGMPFDARGYLIYDLITEEKIKAIADRKLKKLKASPSTADEDTGAPDDKTPDDKPADDEPSPSADTADVNLEAWLRGEVSYPWFMVKKAVRDAHSTNIAKTADMVEFLVHDLKIIPREQVSPELRQLLKD